MTRNESFRMEVTLAPKAQAGLTQIKRLSARLSTPAVCN
jgi:hypothetical protein